MNNESLQPQFATKAPTAAAAVLAFVNYRAGLAGEGSAFTADQLRFYVNNNTEGGVSPSSADRVLRMLRQEGKLGYVVLNRGKSLYRAVPVSPVASFASPTNVV